MPARKAIGTTPLFPVMRSMLLGISIIFPLARMACATDPAPDPAIAAALKQVSAERIRASIEKLVSFGTRSTLSAQDDAAIASGRGIGAAREWIKSEFERYSKDCGGCLEVKTDSFTEAPARRIPSPTQITNVYAVLKGGDPGANDDASGTAVSLECARVLSQLKFPATIMFLTVAGEEQGLNGSRHFAQMARQQDWRIQAVLNNDIVGGNKDPEQDTSVVRVFSEGVPSLPDEKTQRSVGGGDESDSTSRQLARYIADVGRSYEAGVRPLLIFRQDRYLRGGDHSSFNRQGFAAVRFTEYREDFNHQHQNLRTEGGTEYGDLPKFVNFDYIAAVARLNAATLASLASAPAPPARVQIDTSRLENDSTLHWDAAPGATAYEVLWRATSAPDWEHSQPVAAATHATLKLSKDNVIFAVRAVDNEGHRSLAVVPDPEP